MATEEDEEELAPTNVFHIEFDTLGKPGDKNNPVRLLAVRVELSEEIISDMDAKMRVDLRFHPLYEKLEAYVKANPSVKKPKTKH